ACQTLITMVHFVPKEREHVFTTGEDSTVNISGSIRRLTNLFIMLFVVLSGALVYWQVVVAQPVTSNTFSTFTRHCLSDSAPMRGRILDRNNVVLAYSVPSTSPSLCGYKRVYTDPSLAGLIGYYISPLFGSTGIEAQYNNYLNGNTGITGLDNTLNKTLHRPAIGDDIYLTIDDRIQRAANKFFDQYAAQPDNQFVFPTDRGSIIVTDPHTGEILAMVSRPGFDPNKVASLALVDPNKPESASNPTYIDSLIKLDQKRSIEDPLPERPINYRYIPGSTYKTMTLVAGLDSGNWQLNDQFDKQNALGKVVIGPSNGTATASCNNCVNPVQYGQQSCIVLFPKNCGDGQETFGPVGNNISTFTFHYPVNVEYGFTHSDNIIYAQIGAQVGADTWLKYNQSFYVGQSPPFDLPVTPSSVIPQGQTTLKAAQLAENSFGQGVDFVTPFQMSLLDDAVANNGDLMRPWLIMKVVDPTNSAVVQSFGPQGLGSKMKANTAMLVRQAMLGVVRCGSGRFGDPPSPLNPEMWSSPYAIMAKTGTGEVGGGLGAESWVISQAPYPNPKLTIVSMKENGGEGGLVNGPIIKQLYSYIFQNIPQYKLAPVESTDIGQLTTQDNQYCAQTGLLQ
ncbi:MAG TPA: penicillin-binding transpeptidase domain-containing protein, partial [Ktedonobacteraceae bacterium]|nr:penicillin-binding transpeptidase domain-containing protein [Ktedonobacteraceae bacterium]